MFGVILKWLIGILQRKMEDQVLEWVFIRNVNQYKKNRGY